MKSICYILYILYSVNSMNILYSRCYISLLLLLLLIIDVWFLGSETPGIGWMWFYPVETVQQFTIVHHVI